MNESRLTMVTIGCYGKSLTRFIDLPIIDGRVILPHATLIRLFRELNVGPGMTFSIG